MLYETLALLLWPGLLLAVVSIAVLAGAIAIVCTVRVVWQRAHVQRWS